jgi:hypothetical protein
LTPLFATTIFASTHTEDTKMNIADKTRLAYVGSRNAQHKTVSDLVRDSDSWFTPSIYLSAVRQTLESIDLDPFSSVVANRTVCATKILTQSDDALWCKWPTVNSVFMNPPYGRGLINGAVSRFIEEFHKGTFNTGIVLVNNATETRWCQALMRDALAWCWPDQRIAFESVDGKKVSGNTRGQGFFLFVGDTRAQAKTVASFKKAFSGFGIISGRI